MRIIFTLILLASLQSVTGQTQYAWVQKSSLPAMGRHRSTALSCGGRGYMGLGHINSVNDILFSDWWEYDPGTDTWSQKANFGGGLRYHAAGFTIGNKMYVGTGRAPNSVLMTDFWVYDPTLNTWTSVASFPGAARRGAVSFAINGYGFVGTGSYYADFYRYNPTNNTWSSIASLPAAGRISAVGMACNGKGYCGTGDVGGNSGDWWEYNPLNNQWIQRASLPGLPRMEACGFELNGKCYLGTGDNYSSGDNYSDFWCFNPGSNSWIQVADFAGAARRYLVAFTLNGRAYAGTGTSGMNYNDLWEYGSVSGIEEEVSVEINAFPNPATEIITLNFSRSIQDGVVTLYSITGEEIRKYVLNGVQNLVIPREELASGIYTYFLAENEQAAATGKIIFR